MSGSSPPPPVAGAVEPAPPSPPSLAAVRVSATELDNVETTRAALCPTLRRRGWAFVRLPEDARAEVDAVRAHASSFFAASGEAKMAEAGPLRRVGGQVVGFRATEDREFLETRLDYTGRAVPDVEGVSPELSSTVALFSRRLLAVGKHVLAAIATELGAAPATLVSLLDHDDGPVDDTRHTAAVLRLCSYEGALGAGATDPVAFGEHTDTTFLTVAPVSAEPGLQIWEPVPESDVSEPPGGQDGVASSLPPPDTPTPHGRWVMPEADPDASALDLVVFVGEFTQVLSKNAFPAAVHRVTRPQPGRRRLSMPFLIRGRVDATINTAARGDRLGAPGLLELEDMSMREFHLFLELRRRRLVSQQREKEEAAARARAQEASAGEAQEVAAATGTAEGARPPPDTNPRWVLKAT